MLRAGLEGTLTFDQIESASPELIVARRKAKNSRSLSARYQLRLVRVQSAAKAAGPSAVFCSDRTAAQYINTVGALSTHLPRHGAPWMQFITAALVWSW